MWQAITSPQLTTAQSTQWQMWHTEAPEYQYRRGPLTLTWNENTLLNHCHCKIQPWRSEIHQKTRGELFEGSFDNGNPGTKIQFRSLWEQTPAEPQEPPAQPGIETIMSSLANFRLSVSVQLSHRVPLIFVTLLISYMRKQIVAQGCILLTVFGTGNFIIQALVKENKPWMSINIWSYLAARRMFIILITIFTVRGTWNVTRADEHGAARLQLQRVVPYSSSCSVMHGINKC